MRTRTDQGLGEFVERVVSPPGGQPRKMMGVCAAALAKELERCPPDALILMGFLLPTGETMYAPIRALIEADPTGASIVLVDPAIERILKRGTERQTTH